MFQFLKSHCLVWEYSVYGNSKDPRVDPIITSDSVLTDNVYMYTSI